MEPGAHRRKGDGAEIMPMVRAALAEELEAMMDKTSAGAVLDALVAVCHAKGDHLRENWQDETTARAWEALGEKLERLTGDVP